MKRVFKIDVNDSTFRPFGLYHLASAKGFWDSDKWVLVDSFATRDEARDFWEKIKDLPEYLP